MLTLTTGLTYWTDDVNGTSPNHSWAFWAGFYALLQVCALLSLFSLGITLWVFAVKRAGAALHENALATFVRAPLRYFTQTDTGVITNLFSQDFNLIDTELPNALLDTLYSVSLTPNWASCRKMLLMTHYMHTENALCVTCSLALNMVLTNMSADFPSTGPSGCYAYVICIPCYRLPIPRRVAVYCGQVLFEDFSTIASVGPRSQKSDVVRKSGLYQLRSTLTSC